MFLLYPLEISFVMFMLHPGKWKGLCPGWEINRCRLKYFVNYEREGRSPPLKKCWEQLLVRITVQPEVWGGAGGMPRLPGKCFTYDLLCYRKKRAEIRPSLEISLNWIARKVSSTTYQVKAGTKHHSLGRKGYQPLGSFFWCSHQVSSFSYNCWHLSKMEEEW